MKSLHKISDHAYAVFRMVAGFMFAFHGMQILYHVYAEGFPEVTIGTQMWYGGIIELLGGLLVAAGLFTREAAFLCSGTMAVAYFQFHWKFQMGPLVFPALNQGEMSVLYCFIFLLIATCGGVKWCVDKAD